MPCYQVEFYYIKGTLLKNAFSYKATLLASKLIQLKFQLKYGSSLQNTPSPFFCSPQLLCENISYPACLATVIPYCLRVGNVQETPNNIPGPSLVCCQVNSCIQCSDQSLPPFNANANTIHASVLSQTSSWVLSHFLRRTRHLPLSPP